MSRRVMFVQLKTGYEIDRGPSWIGWVDFTRSWATAYYRGRELRRRTGFFGANFYDAREVYEAFLAGRPLPGRENG